MISETTTPINNEAYRKCILNNLPSNSHKCVRYFVGDTIESLNTLNLNYCADGSTAYIISKGSWYTLFHGSWYTMNNTVVNTDETLDPGTIGGSSYTDRLYVNSGKDNTFTNVYNDVFVSEQNETGGREQWLDLRHFPRTYFMFYDVLAQSSYWDYHKGWNGGMGTNIDRETVRILTTIPFNAEDYGITTTKDTLIYTWSDNQSYKDETTKVNDKGEIPRPIHPMRPIPWDEIKEPAIIYVLRPKPNWHHFDGINQNDPRDYSYITGVIKNARVDKSNPTAPEYQLTIKGQWTLLDMNAIRTRITDLHNDLPDNFNSWLISANNGYYQLVKHFSEMYSLAETFTGKFWIDGKKIYRTCIDVTLTGGASTLNRFAVLPTNISDITTWQLNIQNETYILPVPNIGDNAGDVASALQYSVTAFMHKSTGEVRVRAYSSRSGWKLRGIIEYTKTA